MADTANSRIPVIPEALTRHDPVDAGAASATVSTHPVLKRPLSLAVAPSGDLLTVNRGRQLVQVSGSGTVVAVRELDTADPPGGTLFGLATTPGAVSYVANTLAVLRWLRDDRTAGRQAATIRCPGGCVWAGTSQFCDEGN